MIDKLVEIVPINWPKLRNFYTPDNWRNYIAYATIDNYIRWLEQDPSLEYVKFFCLNRDFSDGTFITIANNSIYADTLNSSTENLSKLLQLVDYTEGYTFLSIRPELHPVILDALRKLDIEPSHDYSTLLYYLPKEETIKFEVRPPKDISLRPITETSDFEKINSVWPHNDENPLGHIYFQQLAKYNSNVGAFKNDGCLVTWVLRYEIGLLGALQTDENHFGHGYGLLVTKCVSKMIAEMGHDIYTGIFEKNTASRNLFSKLGYKPIGEVHWITVNV